MRIGVIGGGQLGRMLGLAGIPLGMTFRFLDPAEDCPASAVGEVIHADFDDPRALEKLAAWANVATYEFENVPVAAVESLARSIAVAPGARSLAVAQDRISEKEFFARCGVPVQRFAAVTAESELAPALARVGLPAVLKTRRLGYDGKGQALVRSEIAATMAFRSLGGVPCILEAHVPFEREVSMIAVRAADGAIVAYPPVWNEHRDGILHRSIAPDPAATPALTAELTRHVRAVADALDHVGAICIEFFVVDGSVVANEMAPRVHNSGHWTIEGAVTSQFENHLRAVAGLPLGAAAATGRCAMLNLIGGSPPAAAILAIEGAKLHAYGKDARPGRKLGHITTVAGDHAALAARTASIESLVLAWRRV